MDKVVSKSHGVLTNVSMILGFVSSPVFRQILPIQRVSFNVSERSDRLIVRNLAQTKLIADGGFWDFTADMSRNDLAYSAEGLPAHTDTTYFTDPAGLQIFHLLSHEGKGGRTLLLDAFYTANLLSTLYPTSYSLLSRLRIPFHASGHTGTLLRPIISQPILRHDDSGQLVQVRWNNEDRGVLGARWRPEEVRGWYQAARRFEDLCKGDDAEYWVQLSPGTVVGEWSSSDHR